MIGSFGPYYPQDYSSYQLQPYTQSWLQLNEYDGYSQQDDNEDDYDYKTRPRAHRQAPYHVAQLQNPRLEHTGDLGWSLGYATAYCFRHMNENRIGVAGAIDHARSLTLDRDTAYVIFGLLDKHLFKGKLSDMVYLTWKPMEVFSPGQTSVAGQRALRTTIQLNKTPFRYDMGDIDALLEMLIHQMIHAYFLVCCGSQKPGEKQDGRLLDDVHFGVLLETVNDISSTCKQGPLSMMFYAADRDGGRISSPERRGGFIALDPTATSFDPGLVTGRTCCHRDNRHVQYAQLMNWQVEHYARCLNENWDSRGESVLFFKHGTGRQISRLWGPPSYTYSELICKKQRIAIKKSRVAKYSALKRLADDSKHADIKVPDCPATILHAVWHFIQHGSYSTMSFASRQMDVYGSGPPVLYGGSSPAGPISLHIRVCRLATAMKFAELQQYAIKQLYTVSSTNEDPISFLSQLYEPAPAMCVDLQGWSRKFLARTDGGVGAGVSNYEKIISWHRKRFNDELWEKFSAFKDDVRLAVGSMNSSFTWETDNHAPLTTPPGHGRPILGGAYMPFMLDDPR